MKRLNFYTIPVIILLCFGLTIGVSMLTGYWRVERPTLPRVVDGSFDPYDIRGSYSIGEIMDLFGIPKEDFYTALNLPSSMCASTQLKELEKEVIRVDDNGNPIHFGVSDVREFVATYIGWTGTVPSTKQSEDANTTTAIPAIAPAEAPTIAETGSSTNPEHTEIWTDPRGGTPLSVIYEWGVTRQMLEQEYKINFDEHSLTLDSTLKDLATAAGANTSDVRTFVSIKMKKQ